MNALIRLPNAPTRVVAADLHRGGLVDRYMRITQRGLALQYAYRQQVRR